jgi:hypothetical protein
MIQAQGAMQTINNYICIMQLLRSKLFFLGYNHIQYGG